MSHRTTSGSDWVWYPTRLAIYARDGWRCLRCGDVESLSIDHVAIDGGNGPTNLITLCVSCNSSRQRQPIERFDRALAALAREHVAKPLDRAAARKLARELRPGRFVQHAERARRGPIVVEGVPF